MADAEIGHQSPIVFIENAAAGHRRRHQQHRPTAGSDCRLQRLSVEAPPATRFKNERHLARHAARQPDSVQQSRIGGVGDDHFVINVDGRQQRVEDARKASRGDHAVAGAVGHTRRRGHMRCRGLPKLVLSDERQITVRRVLTGARPGSRDRLLVGRHIGVEVLEA